MKEGVLISKKRFRGDTNSKVLEAQSISDDLELRISHFNSNKSKAQSFDLKCGGTEVTGRDLFEPSDFTYSFKRLQSLDLTLPSLTSTVQSLTNIIMSQGLKAENDEQSKILHDFLNKENLERQSNYSVLLQGLMHSLIYGRCGFRYLSVKDGLKFYPSNEYTTIYHEETSFKGVNIIDGYVVSRNGLSSTYGLTRNVEQNDEQIIFDIDFSKEQGFNTDYIYLKPTHFQNFYFYGNSLNIDTPLNHDLHRIELFNALVNNLSSTVSSANINVSLVKLKDGIFNLANKTASDIVAESSTGKKTKAEQVMGLVKNFANTISTTLFRRVLVLPAKVESIENLSSGVNISDYLDLYKYIELFISKLYGVSDNVLTLENMPRDASSNPIFEQMMKNTIYPKRQVVEEFLNQFIGERIGVNNIKFKEESYATGLRVQNAQMRANVFSTTANAVNKIMKADLTVPQSFVDTELETMTELRKGDDN